MNDHLHHDWDKLFEQLPVDASEEPKHRNELRTRVLGAYESSGAPTIRRQRLKKIGHILMKYKVPHWTAAALLIASILWIASFLGTPAFAVDEVVQNLAKARTARFDMTVKATGLPAQKMKAYYLEPSHFRQELESGYINLVDWAVGKIVGLDPKTKQATVFNMVNVPDEAKKGSQKNQFEAIRDSLQHAIKDPETKVEMLGEKRFDDRKLVGFRFDMPAQRTTIWADPSTRFPVRIEAKMAGPPETTVLMSNYEFNVDLDKSLFSIAIPKGYKVLETDVDASPATEQDLVTALRMCSTASDGAFPTGFDAVSVGKYVATYLIHQGIDQENGPSAVQMQEVLKIGRGFQFALALPKVSDAHYAGTQAKVGEKDKAIFWYKPIDSKSYRVIYADLTIKDSAEPPKVEGAKKLVR